MKFSKVDAVRIPSGTARRITCNGNTMWEPFKMRYVSLGDSIAAGHTINAGWASKYGEGTQFGKNGNTETVIVPECYTDLIRRELKARYGEIKATSFARSGDTVADLMAKLDNPIVWRAIARADIVTVCIGANDVLQPAMTRLDEYFSGDMSGMNGVIEANLATLDNDYSAVSYHALLSKLYSINPDARYVFTTIYNPYKYLHVDEGRNGFWGPLLNSIPDMKLDVLGVTLDIDGFLKDSLLGTPALVDLTNRINALGSWAESYVTRLNSILRNKINAFGQSNFCVADTKAVFDPVPNRTYPSPKHYNDLVSVEYTAGYDASTMDWGKLWGGSDPGTFWWKLVDGHIDGVNIDINGIAQDLVAQVAEKVVVPDVDPHPEEYGHYALYHSFADALGWEELPRRSIIYNAGTYGSGYMAVQKVIALDNMPAFATVHASAFVPNTEGYRYTGWNAAADGSGVAYTGGQLVVLASDLTLYAQWTNLLTVAYRKISNNEYVSPGGQTGPVKKNGSEYYLRVTLGGSVLPGLSDTFNSDGVTRVRTITVPYGTELYIQLINTGSKDRGKVYLNDSVVVGDAEYCYYTTKVKSDMAMTFTWEQEGVDSWVTEAQSYWIARITTN